jgi:hypothetical protein
MTEAAVNQRPIPLSFGLCATHRRINEITSSLLQSPTHPVYLDRVSAALDAVSFIDASTIERLAFLDREGVDTLCRADRPRALHLNRSSGASVLRSPPTV